MLEQPQHVNLYIWEFRVLVWLVQYMRTMLVLVFSVKLVRNFSFCFLFFIFFNQCLLVYDCTGVTVLLYLPHGWYAYILVYAINA